MAEYLDRDALRRAVMASKHDNLHLNSIYRKAHDDEHLHFLAMIDRFPAADVTPVAHGRWVYITSYNDGERVIATCLCCGVRGEVRTIRTESGLWEIDSPCCPDCGAKMDETGGVR